MKTAVFYLFAILIFSNIGLAQPKDYRMSAAAPAYVEPAPTAVEPPVLGIDPSTIIEPELPEEPCFSYRYVEVGYVYQGSDPTWGGSAGGFGTRFSYDFLGPIFAVGSFGRTTGDSNSSMSNARFGLGAYHAITECFQVNLQFGGGWNRTEIRNESESDFGFYGGPGLRTRLKKGVEIFGNIYYSNVGIEDGLAYRAGLIIDLRPNWFLSLSADFTDEAETYFAGIRYVY